MQEVKMSGESLNIEQENISKLKEIFPEVFNEDKIDFDKLQNVLGNYIDTDEEKYRFTWNGKMNALRLSQTPSIGTLRPCKEESKNWDTTQNLYIEGDNLEVLKLLQNSYLNKIKMIYIDPPYNTSNDFVYADDFTDSIDNYKKITGQVDSDGNSTSTNKDSDGRYHTNWLNMMYPRLRLAKNLLKDNGIILISIDEHEITNLLKISDEIFGENNNLGQIIWDKRNPKGETAGVAAQHEYIVVYCKNKNTFATDDYFYRTKEHAESMLNKVKTLINKNSGVIDETIRIAYNEWLKEHKNEFSGGELAYKFIDDNGDIYRPVSMAAPDKPETRSHRPLLHPITGKPCPVPEKGWRCTDTTMDEYLKAGLILFGEDETTQPTRKYLLKDNLSESVPSLLYYGGSGSDDCFGLPFDNPKPLYLMKRLIESCTTNDDIILDFFSGSSTTAHACFEQNCKDKNSRQFIMVQLPELTFEYCNGTRKVKKNSKKAYELGFESICQIARQRINNSREELINNYEDMDLGYKVFKLDSSNMRKWNPDTQNIEQSLLDQINNFVDGRTEEDALYEIILKNGLPLTVPVEELDIKGKKVYSIGMGALIVCLDNNITLDIADEIANISTEFEDKSQVTVVFKDNGFANDSVKTNIKETIRGYGIGKFVTV